MIGERKRPTALLDGRGERSGYGVEKGKAERKAPDMWTGYCKGGNGEDRREEKMEIMGKICNLLVQGKVFCFDLIRDASY